MHVSRLASLEPVATLTMIAGSAAMGASACAYYMGAPVDPIIIATSFSLVFFSYAINRYTDREDAFNDPHQARYFGQNEWLLWISVLLVSASLLWLFLVNKLTWLHWTIGLTSSVYSFRIVPCRRNHRWRLGRLKEVCILKNLVVAVLWGTSYFAISWLVYPSIERPAGEIVFLMVCFAVSCFSNTLFSDIKDVEGDRKAHVPTIPVRYGLRAAYVYGIALPNGVMGIASLYLFFTGFLTLPLLVFCCLNLVYPALYVQLYRTGKCPYKLMRTVTDLSILIFPAGLVVLRLMGP